MSPKLQAALLADLSNIVSAIVDPVLAPVVAWLSLAAEWLSPLAEWLSPLITPALEWLAVEETTIFPLNPREYPDKPLQTTRFTATRLYRITAYAGVIAFVLVSLDPPDTGVFGHFGAACTYGIVTYVAGLGLLFGVSGAQFLPALFSIILPIWAYVYYPTNVRWRRGLLPRHQ